MAQCGDICPLLACSSCQWMSERCHFGSVGRWLPPAQPFCINATGLLPSGRTTQDTAKHAVLTGKRGTITSSAYFTRRAGMHVRTHKIRHIRSYCQTLTIQTLIYDEIQHFELLRVEVEPGHNVKFNNRRG